VTRGLKAAGVDAHLDVNKGDLDHGAWIALHSLWNDQSPLPVVQVSLPMARGDTQRQVRDSFRLGQALSELWKKGIAAYIVASGSVTHSQDRFVKSFLSSGLAFAEADDYSPLARERRRQAAARSTPFQESVEFDKRVRSAVLAGDIEGLLSEDKSTEFAIVHPEPSHWLPLVVALGCASQGGSSLGREIHTGFQHGLSETAFVWDLNETQSAHTITQEVS